MEEINWLSMILATITPVLLGLAYFHPKALGSAFSSDRKPTKRPNGITIILALVFSFFLAFFMLNFNNSPGQEGDFDNFTHGVWHGMFVGIVIALPITAINGIFEGQKLKPLILKTIFWILTFALTGGILDAMNHWPN
ncbi:MAG: DUF1761 domain-containing protein [Bacteroidota bacterium]